MDGKARLGKWVLIVTIIATLLFELATAGLSLRVGQFKGIQIVRMLLTIWLLWRVWEGVGWARWLLAALFFVVASSL